MPYRIVSEIQNMQSLAGEIRSHLSSNGFTVGSFFVDTATDVSFKFSKNGRFFGIRINGDQLFVSVNTQEPTTSYNQYQQGHATYALAASNKIFYPIKRTWFIEKNNVITVVIESTTDCFTHMSFGFMEKIGTWVGDAAFAAGVKQGHGSGSNYQISITSHSVNYAAVIYALAAARGTTSNSTNGVNLGVLTTNDGNYGIFYNGSDADTSATMRITNLAIYDNYCLANMASNRYNGRMTLVMPYYAQMPRTSTDNLYQPIAKLSNIAHCNIAGYIGGEIVNNNWLVFPLTSKTKESSSNGWVKSNNIGLAYNF